MPRFYARRWCRRGNMPCPGAYSPPIRGSRNCPPVCMSAKNQIDALLSVKRKELRPEGKQNPESALCSTSQFPQRHSQPACGVYCLSHRGSPEKTRIGQPKKPKTDSLVLDLDLFPFEHGCAGLQQRLFQSRVIFETRLMIAGRKNRPAQSHRRFLQSSGRFPDGCVGCRSGHR